MTSSLFTSLRRSDNDLPAFDNSAFLYGYLRHGLAQLVRMLEADRRDAYDFGVGDVSGVVDPSEPDFQHRHMNDQLQRGGIIETVHQPRQPP